MMSGPVDRARRCLTEAPADRLVGRLGEYWPESYGITDVELFQVDYRLSALLPLGDGEPITSPGHPAWRCFDHQRRCSPTASPGSRSRMRGERRGVLRLSPRPRRPGRPSHELAEIATAARPRVGGGPAGTDVYAVGPRGPGGSPWPPRCSGSCCPGAAGSGPRSAWPASSSRRTRCAATASTGPTTATGSGCRPSTAWVRGWPPRCSPRWPPTRCATPAGPGWSLADQAALADQAIYALHRGEQHLSALLMELDLRSGDDDRGGRRLAPAGAAARRRGRRAAAGGAVPAGHVRRHRLPASSSFELQPRRPALRGQRRRARRATGSTSGTARRRWTGSCGGPGRWRPWTRSAR